VLLDFEPWPGVCLGAEDKVNRTLRATTLISVGLVLLSAPASAHWQATQGGVAAVPWHAGMPAAASPVRATRAAQLGRASAVPWNIGTVTLVTKINHTFTGKDEYGAQATFTEKATETATYTLTGKGAGKDLVRANMTDSGKRTAIWKGGQPGTCKGTTDVNWSYKGLATVKMVYAAGKLFIYPMQVAGKLRSAFSGCDANQPPTLQAAQLPVYPGTSGLFKPSENASGVIAGKSVFITKETVGAMGLTEVIGTTTLKWTLHKASSGGGCVLKKTCKP
jgi:hypothetical protein